MHSKRYIDLVRLLLTVLSVVLLPAVPALCQTMSFSVYSDAGTGGGDDDLTLTFYETVDDNSSGCSHYNYMTTASITSPSSRYDSNMAGGLFSSASLPFEEEEGNWGASASGFLNCSCMYGGQVGYGGGDTAAVQRFQAVFRYDHEDAFIGKYVYVRDPAVCNGSCQPAQWCSTQHCNWLYIKGVKVGFGFGVVVCQPTPPYPRCSETQPTCQMPFGAVIWNPNNECNGS